MCGSSSVVQSASAIVRTNNPYQVPLFFFLGFAAPPVRPCGVDLLTMWRPVGPRVAFAVASLVAAHLSTYPCRASSLLPQPTPSSRFFISRPPTTIVADLLDHLATRSLDPSPLPSVATTAPSVAQTAPSVEVGRNNRTVGRNNRTVGRTNRTVCRNNRIICRSNCTVCHSNGTVGRTNRTFGRTNGTVCCNSCTVGRNNCPFRVVGGRCIVCPLPGSMLGILSSNI